MKIVRMSREEPDDRALAEAAEVLRRGGLVAFPTETVYGLGANALDRDAVGRIFEAKGRPSFNPLIVHVADIPQARSLVTRWPEAAQRLAERFWPGPLTLVLPKQAAVPEIVTAGLGTVALRVPAHPVAAALIEAAGIPVAAPSANRYTSVSPTTADHVVTGLGDAVELVIDAGSTDVGIESAVVDLSGEWPVLLRPGSISPAEIEVVVGPLEAPGSFGDSAPRPSPGMVERHYAPRARVVLFQRRDVGSGGAGSLAHPVAADSERIGVLHFHSAPVATPHLVRMPEDPLGYARLLYAALHEMDARGVDVIMVEQPPASPAWSGVVDRLRRAAS